MPTSSMHLVYDTSVCGYEQLQTPMLGFTMYEIFTVVKFIVRLIIDYKY
jgi:hypothetical protein